MNRLVTQCLRRRAAFLLLVCALMPAVIGEGKYPIDQKSEIQGVLDKQIDAWNKGDIDGSMAGYSQSPELVYIGNSKVIRSWQSLLELMRQGYKKPGADMGKLELNEEEIIMLSSDSAVVWGRYRVTTKDGKLTPGLYTLVMRKGADGWRTVYDRTSSEKQ